VVITPSAAAAVPAIVLALSMVAALWMAAGSVGLLYPLLFAAACAPGVPIGRMLFGSRHPLAWITGPLIGYGLTQLALWAVIAAGRASAVAFVLAWAIVGAAAVAVCRRVSAHPVVPVTPWATCDLRRLLLVLLLVPMLMGATYRNLGRSDDQGNQYYRAYFTADFLWHSALAYELGKFSLPPRNPYLTPRRMNYYWTYFVLPSTAGQIATGGTGDVQPYLKANAMLVGLLMLAMLFGAVRSATQASAPAAVSVVIAVLAASAEGTYAIVDLLRGGRPLAQLLDTNIDAITAWAFGGLRIDNIPRSLWYTPQHTTSIALGLAGLAVAIHAGAAARLAAIGGAGLALALATTMNPLIGAVCSAIYGVVVTVDTLGRPGALALLVRHGVAALLVAGAVGWGAASHVMEGAGSALDVGWRGFSRNSPLVTLLLSLGPILVPAIAGIRRTPGETVRRAVLAGVTGIVSGLFLLYFVRISEASWVGFRAGQLLLVSIPLLLARAFEVLPRRGFVALAAAILAIGLPTTAIDTYNAQDIGNRRQGPGFRWTLWTTRGQNEAFAWIRRHTAPTDVVQMEPILRAREHWTLIPSFAARRMAAGQPISLLPMPEYQQRSEQVKIVYATADPQEAAAIARRLRIDYLYVDGDDAAAYPRGVAKFHETPKLFERVFANDSVSVYRVR
jgi:hypothetical protein